MSIDRELLAKLHMENPYDGFDETQHPEDLQGWNSYSGNFAEIIHREKPKLVIEIGSWKGASAINMAGRLPDDGLLICVDTWLGSIEHRFHKDHYYESYRMKHGYPQLYYTFLANVKRAGLEHKILPFPNTSLIAARWFKRNDVKADMIYLDGSHEADDVFLDLTEWYDILNTGGTLLGDDWGWESVQEAVAHFRNINGDIFDFNLLCDNQWSMVKKKTREVRSLSSILTSL